MNRFYDYACCFHEKTKEIIWLAFDSNLLQTPVVKPSDFLTVPQALVLSTVHSYFLYTPFYYIRNLVCIVFSRWNVELSLTAPSKKYRFTAPELHAVFLGYHVERGWVKEISLNNVFSPQTSECGAEEFSEFNGKGPCVTAPWDTKVQHKIAMLSFNWSTWTPRRSATSCGAFAIALVGRLVSFSSSSTTTTTT